MGRYAQAKLGVQWS